MWCKVKTLERVNIAKNANEQNDELLTFNFKQIN